MERDQCCWDLGRSPLAKRLLAAAIPARVAHTAKDGTPRISASVVGATATTAKPIGLAEAGLKERQHLQEWVIEHPEVLGPDVKIVAFEFGSWAAHTGTLERDRLDVLALDGDGRLMVVELKRDKAPDTVDMQALKYAALVSRFTRDDLDRVYAQH